MLASANSRTRRVGDGTRRPQPSGKADARSGGGRCSGLQQAVQVHDDIFHFSVVDGALGGAAPGFFGIGVIVEHADEIETLEIDKFKTARILDAAAEDEMKLAHGRPASIKSGACEPANFTSALRPGA